ncbi:hypothetical protein VTK26DRAFT_7884 [Humicola hyalothermophila]
MPTPTATWRKVQLERHLSEGGPVLIKDEHFWVIRNSPPKKHPWTLLCVPLSLGIRLRNLPPLLASLNCPNRFPLHLVRRLIAPHLGNSMIGKELRQRLQWHLATADFSILPEKGVQESAEDDGFLDEMDYSPPAARESSGAYQQTAPSKRPVPQPQTRPAPRTRPPYTRRPACGCARDTTLNGFGVAR